jgi:hypothetical protein
MRSRILDSRPGLSAIVLVPIRTLAVQLHKTMLCVVAVYAGLCGLVYNPALSASWPMAPMLWIRATMRFDPVHFIASSNSFENSVAILEPIARKLIDMADFSVGSMLLKLAFLRALMRLLDMDPYLVRLHKKMPVYFHQAKLAT